MSHCRAHSGEEVQPRLSDASAMFLSDVNAMFLSDVHAMFLSDANATFSSLNRSAFQGLRHARSSQLFSALRAHNNSNSQLATAY